MTEKQTQPSARLIFVFDKENGRLRHVKLARTKQTFTSMTRYYAKHAVVRWMELQDAVKASVELPESEIALCKKRVKEAVLIAHLTHIKSPSRRLQ